jgi:hypothetical protein
VLSSAQQVQAREQAFPSCPNWDSRVSFIMKAKENAKHQTTTFIQLEKSFRVSNPRTEHQRFNAQLALIEMLARRGTNNHFFNGSAVCEPRRLPNVSPNSANASDLARNDPAQRSPSCKIKARIQRLPRRHIGLSTHPPNYRQTKKVKK